MELDALTAYLKERLSKPLPGLEASNEMSAVRRSGAKLNFKYNSAPKAGSVLVLLYEEDGIVRFPLIQRPEYPGVHSGQMALPGGKKEGVETEIETALRETEEEIGIPVSDVEVVGCLSSFYVFASNFQIMPVIGRLHTAPSFIPQEAEVSEIVSAQLDHLTDDRYLKEKIIIPREGIELTAPYFDLEGKTVWGATAMMLNELRWILKEM